MTVADLELDPDYEAELVRAWRLEELERAGYSASVAKQLAERMDVDLHVATKLLTRGCPAETALKILL
jgi:hypothetical protein